MSSTALSGRTARSFLGGRSLVFTLVVDSDTLLLGALFTASMGSRGGLLPVLTAMRVRPLECLRQCGKQAEYQG